MLLSSVILYLLVTLVIGLAASRMVRTADDYLSAGRKIPFLVNSAALFALWFGSETVFGASSEFMEHGVLGVIEDPFGGALCLLLYAIVFVRPLYKMRLITLGDLFRRHYGARVELLAGIFMIVSFFGYVAAQLVALGLLFNFISGIPLVWCIIISAGVVTLYTMAGGMWAVSITDFVQSIVIVLGLSVVAWTVSEVAGGWQNIIEQAPAEMFRFFPRPRPQDWLQWLSAWMVLGLGSLPSQDIFQRMNAASSERVAIRSAITGAVVYLVVAMLPLYLGLSAKVMYAQEVAGMNAQQALPLVVVKHTSIGVQILFFGALLSAIFSTCSGALLAPAGILSENIIRPYWGRELKDRTFLLILRLSVVLIAGISTAMAVARNNIYELVAESSVLGLVTLLVPMFCAIYCRSAHAHGAMLSMIFGFTAWLLAEHVFSLWVPSLLVGFLASILGMIAGNVPRQRLIKKD